MKLRDSLVTRRTFLNGLLGGWAAALAAVLSSPVLKFVSPPYQEPDKVTLPLKDYEALAPNTAKNFAWGGKPGFIKMKDDGTYQAFVGVCSHLDCNVTYLPDKRQFYCACHEGWYDENGINIAGPPPRPLRRLEVLVEGTNMIVKRPGVA